MRVLYREHKLIIYPDGYVAMCGLCYGWDDEKHRDGQLKQLEHHQEQDHN